MTFDAGRGRVALLVGRAGVGNNGPMPWLLHRHLLGELLRVFSLCAAVLVMVTAFGAAIKPLAEDDLIGPLQTAKYITLAIVPMLQFALPFAAGFAATIVLHRVTSDNEILAAAVGGISYRRILLPIVALGVVLVVVMVLLTQWVIPRFWALMERNLAADITRVVQASIQKGLPVQIGDMEIYADRLRIQPHPDDTDAETRLILSRVAAAELDEDGRIVADVAARQAVVDVHRRDGRTYLMLALVDTVVFNGKTGELVYTPQINPDRAIPVAGDLWDDPMFMTQGELLWLRRHPDGYRKVVAAKVALAQSLRDKEMWEHIDTQLATEGMVELIGGKDQRVVVRADRLMQGKFSTADGRSVEVRQFDGQRPDRRVSSDKVTIRLAPGADLGHPAVDLLLSDCEVVDLRSGGAVNERAALTIPNLGVAGLAGDLSKLPYRRLLQRAEDRGGPIQNNAQRVAHAVRALELEIHSRIQRRYALSLTALLLLLLGATLAMWLRESLPLVIYVWAFVPSVLDVILISGGDHMARHDLPTVGFIVMWSGNGLLLLVLLWAYARLARN
jgi:lipopolysaccharide export LptBFGC system permease protein LptF